MENSSIGFSQHEGRARTQPGDRENDRTQNPINDRNGGPARLPLEDGLNPRQRCYLTALAVGRRARRGCRPAQTVSATFAHRGL
jgi:hypothetical protein